MATDFGNAVVAEWAGPAGMQLFDGTILNPGVIVSGIGKDEAEHSDYWKVLGDADTYDGPTESNVSDARSDWSFGVEEGGEGTGRPLTDGQVAEQKSSAKSSRQSKPASVPDPVDAPAPADSTEATS